MNDSLFISNTEKQENRWNGNGVSIRTSNASSSPGYHEGEWLRHRPEAIRSRFGLDIYEGPHFSIVHILTDGAESDLMNFVLSIAIMSSPHGMGARVLGNTSAPGAQCTHHNDRLRPVVLYKKEHKFLEVHHEQHLVETNPPTHLITLLLIYLFVTTTTFKLSSCTSNRVYQ